MMIYKAAALVTLLFLVAACGTSAEKAAFLRQTSSEIGSKGVLIFDMRRDAAKELIQDCHKKTGAVETKISCVEAAMKIVDKPSVE